jgi:signal transduction histidine kinase
LGEYYLAKNDTLSANSYFNVAQKLAHKNQIFEDELKILRLLVLANPNNASYYSNRYIQLNDSLQSVERATRDKFARIEFETDEVTSKNKVVQAENNKLSQRILFILSFCLLLLLVIFLWIRMKVQKNKSRELLLKQDQQKANEVIYQLMLDQQKKIEEGKNIEKQRISQELHDGVMGRLSSIRLNLYILNKKTDEETIKKCLDYIKEIQSVEKEIRTIAHDLNRNLFSSDIDFIGIVENLFTAIKNHSNIDFNLKTGDNIDWSTVDTAIKINIYRIIQEALQNIDKYAAANKVAIRMDKQNTNLKINISDDGVGFNKKNIKNGIGLQNMQKRAEECNGTFHIASTPKKGTKISLLIPI